MPRLRYMKAQIDGVQMFRCEPYNCTMRREACAKRWVEANGGSIRQNGQPDKRLTYGLCAGCPIGKRHTEETDVGDMKPCKKCGAIRQRLVNGEYCKKCSKVMDASIKRAKSHAKPPKNRGRAPKETVPAARAPGRPRATKPKQPADPLVEYISRVRTIQQLEAELVTFVEDHPQIVEQAQDALSTLTTIGAEIVEPIIAEPTSDAARVLIDPPAIDDGLIFGPG